MPINHNKPINIPVNKSASKGLAESPCFFDRAMKLKIELPSSPPKHASLPVRGASAAIPISKKMERSASFSAKSNPPNTSKFGEMATGGRMERSASFGSVLTPLVIKDQSSPTKTGVSPSSRGRSSAAKKLKKDRFQLLDAYIQEHIVSYLNAIDLSAMACVNRSFAHLITNDDQLWVHQYNTHAFYWSMPFPPVVLPLTPGTPTAAPISADGLLAVFATATANATTAAPAVQEQVVTPVTAPVATPVAVEAVPVAAVTPPVVVPAPAAAAVTPALAAIVVPPADISSHPNPKVDVTAKEVTRLLGADRNWSNGKHRSKSSLPNAHATDFTFEGKFLVTAQSKSLQVYNSDTLCSMGKIDLSADTYKACKLRDGKLTVGCNSGVLFYDLASTGCQQVARITTPSYVDCFEMWDNTLAIGGRRTVDLWDTIAQRKIATLTQDHSNYVLGMVKNGNVLATKCGAHISLWDVRSNTQVRRITTETSCQMYFQDNVVAWYVWFDRATKTDRNEIKFFDVRNGMDVCTLNMGDQGISNFYLEGSKLVVVPFSLKPAVWDVRKQKKVVDLHMTATRVQTFRDRMACLGNNGEVNMYKF